MDLFIQYFLTTFCGKTGILLSLDPIDMMFSNNLEFMGHQSACRPYIGLDYFEASLLENP